MPASTKKRVRNVVPDRLDLRDRPYQPAIARAPGARFAAHDRLKLPGLDQGDTNACTGYALASIIRGLLRAAGREPEAKAGVSPYMLYSMARRYDEFPGSEKDE